MHSLVKFANQKFYKKKTVVWGAHCATEVWQAASRVRRPWVSTLRNAECHGASHPGVRFQSRPRYTAMTSWEEITHIPYWKNNNWNQVKKTLSTKGHKPTSAGLPAMQGAGPEMMMSLACKRQTLDPLGQAPPLLGQQTPRPCSWSCPSWALPMEYTCTWHHSNGVQSSSLCIAFIVAGELRRRFALQASSGQTWGSQEGKT